MNMESDLAGVVAAAEHEQVTNARRDSNSGIVSGVAPW